jgi:hypothetical protein
VTPGTKVYVNLDHIWLEAVYYRPSKIMTGSNVYLITDKQDHRRDMLCTLAWDHVKGRV